MKHTGAKTIALTLAAIAAACLAPSGTPTAAAQSGGLTAAFVHTPDHPQPGEEITLEATSTSSSTAPIRHRWDLDGDGQFDDVDGDTATTAFAVAGSYVVRLKAIQPSAVGTSESVAERTLQVGVGTGPNPAPQPTPEIRPPRPSTTGSARGSARC